VVVTFRAATQGRPYRHDPTERQTEICSSEHLKTEEKFKKHHISAKKMIDLVDFFGYNDAE